MPTDVLRAIERRRVLEKHQFWRETALIIGISLMGGLLTLMRAVQSEAFQAVMLAFGTLE